MSDESGEKAIFIDIYDSVLYSLDIQNMAYDEVSQKLNNGGLNAKQKIRGPIMLVTSPNTHFTFCTIFQIWLFFVYFNPRILLILELVLYEQV